MIKTALQVLQIIAALYNPEPAHLTPITCWGTDKTPAAYCEVKVGNGVLGWHDEDDKETRGFYVCAGNEAYGDCVETISPDDAALWEVANTFCTLDDNNKVIDCTTDYKAAKKEAKALAERN